MLEIFASEALTTAGWGVGLAAIGAGLSALAAGVGLGRIGAGTADAVARQPEAGGQIRGTSLLLSFLVEGVALFACVIAILGVLSFNGAVAKSMEMQEKAAAAPAHKP